MNARLASRAGRLRRRSSIRRLDPGSAEGAVRLEADDMGADLAIDPVGAPHDPEALDSAVSHAAPARLVVNARPVPPGTLLAFARETYNVRRKRSRFLPADLFGEPTWDILLDLYVATRENRPVPTTSACIGAHVPPTTALRWLRILEARGLVEREDDGRDGRRTFVRLSEQGLAAMESWLRAALGSLDQAVGGILRPAGPLHMHLAEAAE